MKDKKVRTAITKESFSYFFHFYYAHYVKYATADFQKEIIHLIERNDRDNLFVVAFRGSGKSTVIILYGQFLENKKRSSLLFSVRHKHKQNNI
jgi:hypothetical protein